MATSEDGDRRHTVNESHDRIVVTTNTKRGSGTRDEDKIRVKVKGEDPEEVVTKLDKTLAGLHSSTTDELRSMQPEANDG